MRNILLFLLAIVTLQLNAQIENEIKQFVDSFEIIRNNGRKLLVKSLVNEDVNKANEVYSYIISFTPDGSFLAFSFTEDLFLNLVFGNYSVVLDKALNYKDIYRKYRAEQDEVLMNNCSNLIAKNANKIEESIDDGNFSAEEKALLNVIYLLFKSNQVDENYSLKIKSFKRDYSRSVYNSFVLGYLPGPKVHGAMSFGMGASYLVPTGQLSKSFNPSPGFNMVYDINIGKVYTSLYMQGGSFKLQTPFMAYNDIDTINFESGDSFSYFEGGVLVGYFLKRTEKFHLAPFIGLGGGSLQSNIYEDPEYNDYEVGLFNSFILGIGLHTEFKFHEYEMYNMYGYSQKGYFSFKLDAGYNLITNPAFNEFSGNIAYLRAGIIWGYGKF